MNLHKRVIYDGQAVRADASEAETRFTALKASDDAAYRVEFELDAPAADAYVMIPACAYDGNRFEAVERHYAPMFKESEFGLNPPVRMTEVPRLQRQGDSKMEVTTGDMACPCVCVLNRKTREAFLLFTNQGAHGLNHGVTLIQSGDKLTVSLRAPAKRSLVYRWYEGVPSLRENPEADAPLRVNPGDETVILHRVFTLPCEDVPSLYRAFFELRHILYAPAAQANLPFSRYFKIKEERMNSAHFVEEYGLYTLNARDGRDSSRFGWWQAGWVGGGMNTLPLLLDGNELSRKRCVSALIFAAKNQSEAGWYYGIVCEGKRYGDCFGLYEEKYNFLLIRKHADLTYFMFRQIEAMRRKEIPVPEIVLTSAVKAADAMVRLWKKYGQMGQFINFETDEILVGGSTSGAMAPGALCAAAEVTGNENYLDAAKEIGEYFYRTATLRGVTTGGPGEILQAPDSESACALLESFSVLYEASGEAKWLGYACDAAHQAASWVVPYDYEFPKESRLGKMNVRSAGSVWANVQNKHSAPGMCTASPASLLKIYRATGDKRYLEFMRTVAHFSPQMASYPERPIYSVSGDALRPGEICERVNLSDWEGNKNVGDSIFGASAWPEAALLLTAFEIPGVYAVPSRGVVCASDHVNAWMDGDFLYIQNPTRFDAEVKVMTDTEETLSRPLGLYWQEKMERVCVKSGETEKYRLS